MHMNVTSLVALLGMAIYLIEASRILMTFRQSQQQKLVTANTTGIPLIAGIAVCLHALYVAITFITDQGLSSDIWNALSLTAIVILATLLIAAIRLPIRTLLPLPLLIGAISLGLSSLAKEAAPIAETVHGGGLLTHIISSIIGYSFISLAALLALALHWQQRQLKKRKTGVTLQALPPLQTMESLLFQLIHFGFCFVSLAIVTGFIFVDDLLEQHLAHKTVFTLLSWCIFAVLLAGRHLRGWRGPTAVRWTLIGFTALVLAYFGSKFVLQIILHRN